jgi:hypothetical protein
MWEWLFGRKRPESKRGQDPPQVPGESPPGFTGATTIGPLVEEMKAKGYQGPFANLCDGIMVVTFHGPDVSLEPAWIEPVGNPFQMRVLNCEAFCRDSPMFALGEGADAINARCRQARDDPGGWRPPAAVPDAVTIPCLLSYPVNGERNPDGAQFLAEGMGDLWDIRQFDDHMYFSRSWTGQLLYRAKLLYRPGALFITEVQASRTRPKDVYRIAQDEELSVRQVDFLIKALLYRMEAPAPLPRGLSEERPGSLALFSLTEYGRWGWFPTFEDTTEYRICLNGVTGRFPPPPNHGALLSALRAVEGEDTPETRQQLYDQLRTGVLHLSFVVPEDVRAAIQAGAATLSPETPVEFRAGTWQGEPCCFAYSHPAYRVTRGGGGIEFTGPSLCAQVLQRFDGLGLVINPSGPGTCRLSRAELEMLAQYA